MTTETVSGRTALITGASAGIGKAFAEVFAAKGWNIVLTARRVERLEALASELAAKHKVTATPIAEDLADPEGVQRLAAEIGARGLTIDGLVNNAGFAVPGYYARTAWKDQKNFLQVLVTAPCELTHALLPGMIERRFGRIVNVASVAGPHSRHARSHALCRVQGIHGQILGVASARKPAAQCAHHRALPRLHAHGVSRCGGRPATGLKVRQGVVVHGGGSRAGRL